MRNATTLICQINILLLAPETMSQAEQINLLMLWQLINNGTI